MKIAVVGWLHGKPVPPKGYGGIERFTAVLCKGLKELGHNVTLIAPENSKVEGVSVAETSDLVEAANILAVLMPDVVHDNSCWHPHSPVRQGLKVPFLSTTHVNHAIGWTKNVVYLSYAQRVSHAKQTGATLDSSPVVRVPFNPEYARIGGDYDTLSDYCLFIGSIAPHKGVVEAAKLAGYLGKRLIVAGDMSGWYADEVKAYHHVEYVGPVDGIGKRMLIENAYAVMCLSNNYNDWSEPGCGVVGEANALNVPVYALNNGCLPEIVSNCENGWIADNWFQLVDQTLKCPSITTSRQYAEQWSVDKIASQYVELYNKLLDGYTWG